MFPLDLTRYPLLSSRFVNSAFLSLVLVLGLTGCDVKKPGTSLVTPAVELSDSPKSASPNSTTPKSEPKSTSSQSGNTGPIKINAPKVIRVFSQTLHVNQQAPSASDSNSGSASSPLKTIAAAAALAGPGTEILVYPGIYREEIKLSTSGTEDAPIVFRSKVPHEAIVSGSDVLSEWTMEGGNVYSYKIPYLEYGWGNHFFRSQWLYMDDEPLRRWEFQGVEFEGKTDLGTDFVNHPHRKIQKPSELDEMTFAVNPETSTLYVKLERDQKPTDHLFELARRQGLFETVDESLVDYIQIRDFTIKHNAGWFRGQAAVTIMGSHWEVVNNRILWSSATGLKLSKSSHALVEDNEILWSGQIGAAANSTGNMIFRNNRIAYSNWVPHDGNWEGGSTKFTTIVDSVFEGNTLAYAHGGGIWFDVYGSSSLIKNNVSHDHTGMGLFSELSWLDTYIGNVCYRNRWGLVIGQSQATYFKNNVSFENQTGMQLFGGYRRKSFMNRDELVDKYADMVAQIPGISERRQMLYEANLKRFWSFLPMLPLLVNVFEENMIFDNNYNVDEDRNYLTDKGPITIWHNNFSEKNIYWHDRADHLFVSLSARPTNQKYQYRSFDEWKRASGKDSTSRLEDPRADTFVTPDWATPFSKHWEKERMPYLETYNQTSEYKVLPTANSTIFGSRIAEAPRKKTLNVSGGRIEAHIIEHEGEIVLAFYMPQKSAWGESVEVEIYPGTTNAVIESSFLKRTPAELERGAFTIRASFYPIYIRGIDPQTVRINVL